MNKLPTLSIAPYDYLLPDDRIARFPLPRRDESKLLVYKQGTITEQVFSQVPDWIPSGSLLVFNNTKVIQARLIFLKETGAAIEIFCLEPHDPADYTQSFAQNHSCTWSCLVGNSRRWKGERLYCAVADCRCSAERLETRSDAHLIRFEWDNPAWSFADILEKFGELPLPPYLNRRSEERDKVTYQTVYSKIKGSVAAPTAGLHFTKEVLKTLQSKQVDLEELTLHVGAGTFKPVRSTLLADHEMHTESIAVRRSTIDRLLARRGRVYAVGTTSVRTLESLYYIGLLLETSPDTEPSALSVGQWAPYIHQPNILPEKALLNIQSYMQRQGLDVLTAHTQILIAPSYDFKLVDGMITNFHQPKSTLLLLISAFVGEDWRRIYDYALENNFRFLSYGDSSLLIR
jgi:S-adenosylmethionine:tRNA ribosyltransferase-isomerase